MADHLVLVRHAKAEDLAEAPDDLSRRLTWSGEHASRYAMGRVAPLVERDLGEGPIQVWASGAVRARQTAEAAAKALGLGHGDVRVVGSLTASDADAFLSELAAAEGTVVAVGHNPFAERLVRQECGCELRFGKAAAACLAPATPGSGHRCELEWFVQGPDNGRWETLASLLGKGRHGAGRRRCDSHLRPGPAGSYRGDPRKACRVGRCRSGRAPGTGIARRAARSRAQGKGRAGGGPS